MIKIVIVALATLIPLAPVVMYFVSLRTKDPVKAAQKLVSGFKGYNVVLVLMGLAIGVVWLFSPQTVLAAAQQTSDESLAKGLAYLAAAISTGLARSAYLLPRVAEVRIFMKILVIGHPEAVLGFSLTGVGGRVATTADEVNQALDEAQASRDVGIVLVTQDVAALIPARMEHLKLRSTVPLVVEIPAEGGAPEGQASLGEIVLRAIGIRL